MKNICAEMHHHSCNIEIRHQIVLLFLSTQDKVPNKISVSEIFYIAQEIDVLTTKKNVLKLT